MDFISWVALFKSGILIFIFHICSYRKRKKLIHQVAHLASKMIRSKIQKLPMLIMKYPITFFRSSNTSQKANVIFIYYPFEEEKPLPVSSIECDACHLKEWLTCRPSAISFYYIVACQASPGSVFYYEIKGVASIS